MPRSPDIAAFIRGHFSSVWTLELLLFLKNGSSEAWQNERLVQALRASAAIVTKSSEVLLAGGLIIADDEGRVQYGPASDSLRQLVDETQELYARKPDAVRRLIVSSAGIGLSAFADSFRLRRD
jgi:hypothetical protein